MECKSVEIEIYILSLVNIGITNMLIVQNRTRFLITSHSIFCLCSRAMKNPVYVSVDVFFFSIMMNIQKLELVLKSYILMVQDGSRDDVLNAVLDAIKIKDYARCIELLATLSDEKETDSLLLGYINNKKPHD